MVDHQHSPHRALTIIRSAFQFPMARHSRSKASKAPTAAAAASSVATASAASALAPQSSSETPAELLGFAAPHAQLSDLVHSAFDQMISSAEANPEQQPLVTHMRRGLEQLQAFMQQYADVDSFEALAQRDSQVWQQHVDHARSEKATMSVQTRTLQPQLQLALAAVDLKVGRRGRPDDSVYQSSEYCCQYMPRGNFVGQWTNPTTGEPLFFPVIRAYRKFTGQEDDAESGKTALGQAFVSKFFTKPMEEAQTVISTTKENGEAAHLAVLKRSDGQFLFAVGSKNTHMIVRSLEDIENACAAGCTNGGNPYMAAKPIATAIMNMLDRLSQAHRSLLCEFLWQTRATASFELLCVDHQHVQLLDFIKEDTPVFYGLSLPTYYAMPGAEICVNPVLAYELLRSMGIRTVTYKVLPYTPDVFATALREIRSAYQHEGAVNLFLDSTASVIGMEKYKTTWYVCLRAIREKAKAFISARLSKKSTKSADEILADSKRKLRSRFRDIKTYLQLSAEVTNAYCTLGEEFVEYLSVQRLAKVESKEQVQELKHDVADLFPVVWSQFLRDAECSDEILEA